MKIAIIINASRYSDELSKTLSDPELADKYNLTYEVFVKKPHELEKFIKDLDLKSYNAYIIGGGDGTVRTVIQSLIEQDVAIAILPLGSFNFLATTLKSPDNIEGIFKMVINGKIQKIDLGDVNGRVFVNQSWLGFYYYLLKKREKYHRLLGTNRVLKTIFNAVNMFNSMPSYELEFTIDHQVTKLRTSLVYISNNDQYTNIANFSERKSLSQGVIAIHIFNSDSRWELFKCMLDILNNKLEESPFVTKYIADNLIINSVYPQINMVLDGELCKIETPLSYSVHKRQIKVFVP